MEDRLSKALEFANYRQTLNNRLHKTKLKIEGLLSIAKNGGLFKINHELICFLDYLERSGSECVTILDCNNIPISIDNIPEFLKEVRVRYFEVTNDYLQEYQQIRKSRSIKSMLDIGI
jgi:hypothetical protein